MCCSGGSMYKIAICDDNILFLNDLSERIKRYSSLNNTPIIIQCFQDSDAIIDLLDENRIFDAYILDIEMPYISGIDLIKMIKKVSKVPLIILITAFSSYAIDVCGLGIFRYLLKDNIQTDLVELLDQLFYNLRIQNDDKMYIIDNNRKYVKFYQKDIIYIYKEGKNVVFSLSNDRIEKQRLTLQAVFKKFINLEMFFLDRGYILNIRHIDKIHSDMIVMDNDFKIVTSHINIIKIKKYLCTYWGGII